MTLIDHGVIFRLGLSLESPLLLNGSQCHVLLTSPILNREFWRREVCLGIRSLSN